MLPYRYCTVLYNTVQHPYCTVNLRYTTVTVFASIFDWSFDLAQAVNQLHLSSEHCVCSIKISWNGMDSGNLVRFGSWFFLLSSGFADSKRHRSNFCFWFFKIVLYSTIVYFLLTVITYSTVSFCVDRLKYWISSSSDSTNLSNDFSKWYSHLVRTAFSNDNV